MEVIEFIWILRCLNEVWVMIKMTGIRILYYKGSSNKTYDFHNPYIVTIWVGGWIRIISL